MAKTYTYDPSKIKDNGVDRMRLQLGDTIIEGGEETCPLCDEEYQALIEESKSWRKARIACLSAIVAKMAYEVDYSADGLSFSLGRRYDRWKAMLDSEKRGQQIPIANAAALGAGRADGGHYFTLGMLNNPNAAGSE